VKRKALLILFLVGFSLSTLAFGESAQKQMLKRADLPIAVRDEVWNLIEQVQAIEPLQLKIDPTRRDGTVTPNVDAQFWFNPRTLEIGILLYEPEPSEHLLAHEVLHAWRTVVQGFPRVYPKDLQFLAMLDNSIQHQHIFQVLEEMGFEAIAEAREEWERGVLVMNELGDRMTAGKSTRELIILGAITALDGLMVGLAPEKVRQDLLPKLRQGVDKAVEINEELSKTDLTDMQENFTIRQRIASILGLTAKDAVIMKFDFKVRGVYSYDPVSGKPRD